MEAGALLDRYLAAVGEPLRFADRACDFPYLALYLLMLDVILSARGPILCPMTGSAARASSWTFEARSTIMSG